MNRLSLRLLVGALLGALAVAPEPAGAHGGVDDEPPAPAATGASAAPRAEAASDAFELVAVVRGQNLILTLDQFATDEPITAATIDVTEGNATTRADAHPDGTFAASAPWTTGSGAHELTFTVTAGNTSDLLIATLVIPDAIAAVTASTATPVARLLGAQRGPVTTGLVFALGMLTVLAFRARGRGRTIAVGAVLLVGLFAAGAAFAHGGVDDSDGSPPPMQSDAPRRLPDGSVAMAKDAQRLLAVRTVLAVQARSPRTVQLIGQIIPDPAAAGRVQSTQSGRVQAGDGGLAHVGQAVRAGDALATVVPVITGVERGGVQAQVAELDAQIRIAQQKFARLGALAGSVAGKDIADAKSELEGVRARRAALSPTLVQGEVLRAPVSGIVSVANVTTGQIVESRDVLFEIVDPKRLWVEAIAFDPTSAGQMTGASGRTADGTALDVAFIGRGLALRQGATPLQFRIEDPPDTLSVGAPVTVIANLSASETGIALPRASVVRMPNGGAAVWDHVSAERFVPRPVRLQPLDAGRVLVLAGIRPEHRIVVQGADLLNQVR